MKLKPIFPKEHGIWFMFIIPILSTAVTVGRINIPAILFTLSSIFFFLARHPIIKIVKNLQKVEKLYYEVVLWACIYLFLSAILFSPIIIIYDYDYSLIFVVVILCLLVLNIIQAINKTQREIINEIINILGLTLIAPGLYYILTNSINIWSYWLWGLWAFHFIGSIFFVRSKAMINSYGLLSIIYYTVGVLIILLSALLSGMSLIIGLCAIPIIMKMCYFYIKRFIKVSIYRIAIIEAIHSVLFAVLIVYFFNMSY